jgi:hypothetical protein
MLRVMPQRNWSEEPANDWVERHAHLIAMAVRDNRTKRSTQLSAQQLADKTAELGVPVSRTVIADLENGRRRYVTTTELLAFAEALSVSPVDLLFPGGEDQQIEILPDVFMTKSEASLAFSGFDDETMRAVSEQIAEQVAVLEQAVMDGKMQTEATAQKLEEFSERTKGAKLQLEEMKQLNALKREQINQMKEEAALLQEQTATLREQSALYRPIAEEESPDGG